MLHVDINKSHVNIIMLHVDIIYLACRGQKYATIDLKKIIFAFGKISVIKLGVLDVKICDKSQTSYD